MSAGKSERVSPLVALRIDLEAYLVDHHGFFARTKRVLTKCEVWILCMVRWGTWIREDCPAWLRPLFRIVWQPWYMTVVTLLDTHIAETSRIGPGLFISHYGGIRINPNVRIGRLCHLGKGVVIGAAGEPVGDQFTPVIGDRVWIGPHAVISGTITVGDDAVIGANSLVVEDVPNSAVMVGVPAELRSRHGSGRLIRPVGDSPDAPRA